MAENRLSYSIKPENHEKLVLLQAFMVLDKRRSADLSDLVNLAIERLFDTVVENLEKDSNKYRSLLADMLRCTAEDS